VNILLFEAVGLLGVTVLHDRMEISRYCCVGWCAVTHCVIYFLRATVRNAKHVIAIVEASVRPTYCGIVSKRRKLRSRDLHCGLPQGL